MGPEDNIQVPPSEEKLYNTTVYARGAVSYVFGTKLKIEICGTNRL